MLSVEVPERSESSAPTQAYILPLFAIMTAEQQAKVFHTPPEGHRLIVVATNVESLDCHEYCSHYNLS